MWDGNLLAFAKGQFFVGIKKKKLQYEIVRIGTGVIENIHIHFQNTVGKCVVRRGPGEKVPDPDPGGAVQIDIPLDTADSPEILAFQVGSVRPSVHLDSQSVRAFRYKIRYIPFSRCLGALTVAHLSAVDPDIKSGFDGGEMDKNPAVPPFLRKVEVPAVGADGIVIMGDMWRIRIARPFIRVVDIYGDSVTLKLPVGRDRDAVPAAHIKIRKKKIRRPIRRFADPVELP